MKIVETDEPHVMGQRHPGQAHVLRGQLRRLAHPIAIGQDIAMTQYHALGLAGGPGGELDEGHILWHCRVRFAGP